MKSILLHGPASDAAGQFVDAGNALEVNDSGDAGTISADEAKRLLDAGRAVTGDEASADEFGDATIADLRELAGREEIVIDGLSRKDDIKVAIRAARQERAVSDTNLLPPVQ